MCLIFDAFPARADAEAFAKGAAERTGLDAQVFNSQAESNAEDWFPCKLTPPIVLVDRMEDDAAEQAVEDLVLEFGGRFAGT